MCQFFLSKKGCSRCAHDADGNVIESWCHFAHSAEELRPDVAAVPHILNQVDFEENRERLVVSGLTWCCEGFDDPNAGDKTHNERPEKNPQCEECGLLYWEKELEKVVEPCVKGTAKLIHRPYKVKPCPTVATEIGVKSDQLVFFHALNHCEHGFVCRFAHSADELESCRARQEPFVKQKVKASYSEREPSLPRKDASDSEEEREAVKAAAGLRNKLFHEKYCELIGGVNPEEFTDRRGAIQVTEESTTRGGRELTNPTARWMMYGGLRYKPSATQVITYSENDSEDDDEDDKPEEPEQDVKSEQVQRSSSRVREKTRTQVEARLTPDETKDAVDVVKTTLGELDYPLSFFDQDWIQQIAQAGLARGLSGYADMLKTQQEWDKSDPSLEDLAHAQVASADKKV